MGLLFRRFLLTRKRRESCYFGMLLLANERSNFEKLRSISYLLRTPNKTMTKVLTFFNRTVFSGFGWRTWNASLSFYFCRADGKVAFYLNLLSRRMNAISKSCSYLLVLRKLKILSNFVKSPNGTLLAPSFVLPSSIFKTSSYA